MPSDDLDDGGRCPVDPPLINIRSKHQEKQRNEKCPRCESRDTKFCYYNNYNTSQPRHYCRFCRRYWTLGGSLRNVPIGGSSRNNKRLRPNPSPSTPHHHHVYSVSQLMTGVVSSFNPPFGFDLGLGLGSMKAGPDPTATASMEDVGFGMGPTGLQVWGLDTWRVENGGGGAATGECGGGPTNGVVR